MKHLINREDYIKEYLHISNYIENVEKVDNENELDEGLLGTLFGGLKMLLKNSLVSTAVLRLKTNIAPFLSLTTMPTGLAL